MPEDMIKLFKRTSSLFMKRKTHTCIESLHILVRACLISGQITIFVIAVAFFGNTLIAYFLGG